MRKVIVMVILCTVLIIMASGCIVSIKGDGCQSHKAIEHPEPDSTIAEIDAVHSLVSEEARLNVLRAIARRPGLSPEARIHLVETATHVLVSEQAREEVLMGLAENPPIVPEPPAPVPCEEEHGD